MKSIVNPLVTNYFVSKTTSMKDTIRVIDHSNIQIALVVDEDNKLIGTVTDGDIRRALIKGATLDQQTGEVMNPNPTFVIVGEDPQKIFDLMKRKRLHQIPVLNEQGQVVDIKLFESFIEALPKENWVVLMAGGLGTRLRPLTDDCPKPLLKVGDKPILETTITSLIKYGFHRFYLSVNYRGDMIEDYFGDGSKWGVEIRYIYEDKRLGTAGALSLLTGEPTKPIIVMNGDLLTNVNFSLLLDYHLGIQSSATMCVREYDYQIPYGVVRLNDHKLVGIEEKPIQRSFVSAGIYVLDPSVLKYIPKDEFYDMPSLFEELIEKSYSTSVFPVREYWCDIGRIDDYYKANSDYEKVFK